MKQFRILAFLVLLLCGVCAAKPQVDDWENVKRLLAGSEITVKGESSKIRCILVNATDRILVCSPVVLGGTRVSRSNVTVDRAMVREIRLVHSSEEQRAAGSINGAIAGAIIGTVGGIAAGPPRLLRVLIVGPLLAGFGSVIGQAAHPSGSMLVYRCPQNKKSRGVQCAAPGKQTNVQSAP